jgi:hypothetical protein
MISVQIKEEIRNISSDIQEKTYTSLNEINLQNMEQEISFET